jgi:hypothetical protein
MEVSHYIRIDCSWHPLQRLCSAGADTVRVLVVRAASLLTIIQDRILNGLLLSGARPLSGCAKESTS